MEEKKSNRFLRVLQWTEFVNRWRNLYLLVGIFINRWDVLVFFFFCFFLSDAGAN